VAKSRDLQIFMATASRNVDGIVIESKPTRRNPSRWIAGGGRVVIIKAKGPEPWLVYRAGSPVEGDEPIGIPAGNLLDAVRFNEHAILKAIFE
jgi:hypothetical protein